MILVAVLQLLLTCLVMFQVYEFLLVSSPQILEFESVARTLKGYRASTVRLQNLIVMRPCNFFSLQRKIVLCLPCCVCEGRYHGTDFNKQKFFLIDPMLIKT